VLSLTVRHFNHRDTENTEQVQRKLKIKRYPSAV
jgi:hypothetical protein